MLCWYKKNGGQEDKLTLTNVLIAMTGILVEVRVSFLSAKYKQFILQKLLLLCRLNLGKLFMETGAYR